LSSVYCDIPVHCVYEDFYGEWTYSLGPGGNDNSIDCSQPFTVKSTITINLAYPDVVLDGDGHSGFWTRIYDEGAEVVLNGVKYFAFVKWNFTSFDCTQTMPGWYHNQDGTNWGCFVGKKNTQFVAKPPNPILGTNGDLKFPLPDHHHPILSERSDNQFVTKFDLPENWDWRNVNGVNYVSPVRDQGNCGSCYAFGTMAMIESRVRIMTNNKLQPVLSTQNIVSCSEYSQGCEGGFPYLISKYGQDFQYFSEDCFPYTGRDSACKTCDLTKTDLYHATGYYYVGGHFGACSPEEMMFDVYINGPVAVSFEVYDDFKTYTGGVYTHNSTMKRMNEWEATNHAVCLVGWGVDEGGIPYWTVKNSWGSAWGEKGYFRIRRNTDECAIESMAMSARPVLPEGY
jgi:cathepsin C